MRRRPPPFISRRVFALNDFFYRAQPRVTRLLNGVYLVVAATALATLVAEYGFDLPTKWRTATHALTVIVVWWFVLNNLVRLIIARRPREYFRSHWFDYALMALLLLGYGAAVPFTGVDAARDTIAYFIGKLDAPLTRVHRLYIAIAKVYILIVLLASGARYGHRLLQARFRPIHAVVLSFLLVILVGTMLFKLPNATVTPGALPWSDALFTSVSAVCVTGLIVVDTATVCTWFGQSVLIALIQVGGLGYMTLASFFVLFSGATGGLRGYAYMRHVLDDATIASARRNVVRSVLATAAIELVGAAVLYASLPADSGVMSPRPVWFQAVFHSVSAFCNAGFSIWTRGLAEPQLQFSLAVNVTIMVLLILGGLGFTVLTDIWRVSGRAFGRGRRAAPLSIQSRMVLAISALLLALGAGALLVLEQSGALAGLGPSQRVLASIFQSATARTAGLIGGDGSAWRGRTDRRTER